MALRTVLSFSFSTSLRTTEMSRGPSSCESGRDQRRARKSAPVEAHSLKDLEGLLLLLHVELDDGLEAGLGFICEMASLAGFLARDGDDATNTLGNARFLSDDEVLDVSGLGDVPASERLARR